MVESNDAQLKLKHQLDLAQETLATTTTKLNDKDAELMDVYKKMTEMKLKLVDRNRHIKELSAHRDKLQDDLNKMKNALKQIDRVTDSINPRARGGGKTAHAIAHKVLEDAGEQLAQLQVRARGGDEAEEEQQPAAEEAVEEEEVQERSSKGLFARLGLAWQQTR